MLQRNEVRRGHIEIVTRPGGNGPVLVRVK